MHVIHGPRRSIAPLVAALILAAVAWPAAPALAQTAPVTIPVGTNPNGVAVNPTTNRLYVANAGSNTVSVIDTTSNIVVATIPVGTQPWAVAVNPTTNRVYVTNFRDGSVSVIDGASNTVATTVSVGSIPFDVGVNPTTNRVYVAANQGHSVAVLDGANHAPIGAIAIEYPTGVAVDSTANRIYVASQLGRLHTVNGATNAIEGAVQVGENPFGAAVNPTTNRVYVTNEAAASMSVVNATTNTVVATVPVGGSPRPMAVNPTNNRVYVPSGFDRSLLVVDGATNSLVAGVPVGDGPNGVAVDRAAGRVYVSLYGGNSVAVLEEAGLTNPVTTTSQTLTAAGTVTTGTVASASDPVATSVSTTGAGTVTIAEVAPTGPPPAGFAFLGQQVNITAPVGSLAAPLRITFVLDASLIPADETHETIQVLRNGAVVPACAVDESGEPVLPLVATTANPVGECVASRALLPAGDVRITVMTAEASRWNFAKKGQAQDPYASLCDLAKRYAKNEGIGRSLCAKLDAAKAATARRDGAGKARALEAFKQEVTAQTDKALTREQAAELIKLAEALAR